MLQQGQVFELATRRPRREASLGLSVPSRRARLEARAARWLQDEEDARTALQRVLEASPARARGGEEADPSPSSSTSTSLSTRSRL